MKIISKFKDYYDYLTGIYGIDEKVVYVRQMTTSGGKPELIHFSSTNDCYWPNFGKFEVKLSVLYVLGVKYVFCEYKGKIYYGEEIESILDKKDIYNISELKTTYKNAVFGISEFWRSTPAIHLSKTDLNDKYNCPIIIGPLYDSPDQRYLNPRLSDYEFGRIIDPTTMYYNLSTFLAREKVIEDKMSDKEKIVSHGFDLKTSFRGK